MRHIWESETETETETDGQTDTETDTETGTKTMTQSTRLLQVPQTTDFLLGELSLACRPPEPTFFFFPFRSPVPCRSISEELRLVLAEFFSCSFLFSSLLSFLRFSLSICTSCHQASNVCGELYGWSLHNTNDLWVVDDVCTSSSLLPMTWVVADVCTSSCMLPMTSEW